MKFYSVSSFIISLSILLFGLAFADKVLGQGRRSGSVSIGHPNDGKLWAGKMLPRKGKGFLSNQARPNAGAVYGTDEVIAALIKAGADVAERAPGATLFINDISFFEGGDIPHHHSHRAGRDADLLFFQLDELGKVAPPVCIRFDAEGRASWSNRTADSTADDQQRILDVRRNWHVLRSLIENREAHVQRIFVAEDIRRMLLEFAVDDGQPSWVIERAGDVMCEPRAPHDDHFHVRFFCTSEDYARGCRDMWPLYPWRRTELAAMGLTAPELGHLFRRRPRKPAKQMRPPQKARKTPGRLWCP